MLWKMMNIQLTKGSIVPVHGDSAPFLKDVYRKAAQI